MTEVEWLASDDAKQMLLFLRGRSERKRRLFACACCRRIWRLLGSDHRFAVEVAERYADGLADEEERSTSAILVESAEDAEDLESPRYLAKVAASYVVQSDEDCEDTLDFETEDCAILTADCAANAVRTPKRETTVHCQYLRDIYGNPFKKRTKFNKAWRSDTVLSLARHVYESRDFSAMPILADALQDAGCTNDDILNHCRDEKLNHVRGCWVVDLVLGKE